MANEERTGREEARTGEDSLPQIAEVVMTSRRIIEPEEVYITTRDGRHIVLEYSPSCFTQKELSHEEYLAGVRGVSGREDRISFTRYNIEK
jgi:hypothetical protein